MAVSRREMQLSADIVTPASGGPAPVGADPGPASADAALSRDSLPEMLDEGHRASFHPNTTTVDAGFFTWEIESGEVICDPVTFRMHGLPEDGPATMDHFLSRVPPSDLAQLLQVMEQMVAAMGNYQIEYRILAPDGSLRSMEARGRILQGPDGRPGRMIGLVTDTTSTRNAREAEKRRLRNFADRARRMRDFTAALASAITVSAIVDAAREGLEAYGADSLILVAPRDGRLEVAATFGFDDGSVSALTGLRSAQPAPISAAIQWRAPVYLSSPQILEEDYPHLAEVLRHAPQQAWVALPVQDSAGEAGACLFGFREVHDFPAEERAQLFAASGLLALSLERARMYETQRALAAELQRGVLPRGTLTAAGLTIATRYRAATSGIEIGGDFYDVVPLADGRVALIIGDVEGHNLIAASLMGRLRTTVHAYAREGHGPAEVLVRANHWLVDLNADPDMARFATCCLVVVDPEARQLTMCRAGHPPAVLVAPGKRPRVLHCDAGLPLGVDATAAYTTTDLPVEPGSLLVLATDGLLETDSGDEYLSSLLHVLRLGTTDDLEVLADDLLSVPRRRTRHSDDVALLLARVDDSTGSNDRRTAPNAKQNLGADADMSLRRRR